MSHFYADIKGNRGEATRCGSKDSGMRGHIRGWNLGASVSMHVNSKGEDVVSVYLTSGSGGCSSVSLGTLTRNEYLHLLNKGGE